MKTIKNGRDNASESFEDVIIEEFKNKRFAIMSLQDSLSATDEPRLLGITLQRIILANGGFSYVAELTGIGREALYRAVSLKSTPKIQTVYQILSALDIPFSFPRAKKTVKRTTRSADKGAKRSSLKITPKKGIKK